MNCSFSFLHAKRRHWSKDTSGESPWYHLPRHLNLSDFPNSIRCTITNNQIFNTRWSIFNAEWTKAGKLLLNKYIFLNYFLPQDRVIHFHKSSLLVHTVENIDPVFKTRCVKVVETIYQSFWNGCPCYLDRQLNSSVNLRTGSNRQTPTYCLHLQTEWSPHFISSTHFHHWYYELDQMLIVSLH